MVASKKTIVVLAGDGVGPEVVAEAVKVLKLVSQRRGHARNIELDFKEELIGIAAIEATGQPLPDSALAAAQSADAILLGAVGGLPGAAISSGPRPEQGLLKLRKSLDLYANLRPVTFASDSLVGLSPLKDHVVKGTDFVFVRELVGGIYFGERKEAGEDAFDTLPYSKEEIQRITRLAAHLALQQKPVAKIHSIDKANVLATSRLWRKTVTETLEKEFPTIPFDHHLVDSAAMYMVQNPRKLNGVVLTENMFGDILSDEASVIVGSLGLLPSASLNGLPDGKGKCVGLYEPIHGSAPDIAGQGIANPIATILSAALLLRYSLGLEAEAKAIEDAVRKVLDDYETAGLGLGYRTKDLGGDKTTKQVGDKVVEILDALLEGLNAADRTTVLRGPALSKPAGRRPMTLCEKIIAHAAINLPAPGHVSPGDMVCVSVDWTIASELTWKGMEKTYDQMGRPSIYRNDRFWLAIDHTVDPRINHLPKPTELIQASADFAKEAKLIDFYTPNYSILHTEFYRERAQPGQLVIGADSHSCSAGAVGAFAVGLGAADVVMPLVTGETWFKVPETVEIRFVGQPPFGIGGKDTILYVLGELKRNTVAFERAVEWTGPGLKYLSCDARFAISNMSTEFGGIAGVFEADEQTAAYIAKRKNKAHKSSALYFRADPEAYYADRHIIDLSKVESLVALYPSPDNVVPVGQTAGMKLDGVFIGACTTAEEDLILAALVLEQALKRGLVPSITGKRRVTPGSVPILAKLRRLGLLKFYEAAGFDIGAPGCSYCIAVAADKANEGEVWLSSQNRNFKNRMGKGSIGNLASAATVAASSFEMAVRDPREFLDLIDRKRYQEMLDIWLDQGEPFVISEPNPVTFDPANPAASAEPGQKAPPVSFVDRVHGKVQRFEDNVDTDAIIPAQFMPGKDDIDLGGHAFQFVRPEFVERVKQGFNIVVGGIGFGSGSSREEAPRALMGAGVQAVIAKSYAFIYGRNQQNMGLLGILLEDERFYELAQEGAEVDIDLLKRVITIGGEQFGFSLNDFQFKLLANGGVTNMYNKFGKGLFRKAMAADDLGSDGGHACGPNGKDVSNGGGKACGPDGKELAW
ncbi:Isocitrate/isopropylmalate dehydrogenase-domain-containing protein [Jimgerdemannia flammicorona]|uniref:3-isopropylmalate dehydrogenase n=2 Tax=Jimgerdemannia flammicorona TaxID=994334 RepID=A0A433QBC4_9FUNG|nr:Isocitrate/isopropylmalate dehydrogenase-domain-containing protein [Jimgerdemannia flammicorona]